MNLCLSKAISFRVAAYPSVLFLRLGSLILISVAFNYYLRMVWGKKDIGYN